MDIGAPVINREILKSESNKIRQAKLNRINITLTKKKEINESYKAMCELISDDALLVGFCRCVHWEFGELTTEEAIYALRQEILVLLTDKVFGNRSVEIIFRVLLSEINRCSQETDASLRSVDKTDLQKLLDLTDAEIQERIDPKFIRLIGIELEEIKDRIKNVELVQENHEAALKNLKPRILESTDLSLVPYLINVDNVFGWQNEIKEVFDLIADKKFISIHNFGGVGKTTFAKKFLAQYRDHYNNVIWLNVENSVSESIVLNTPLQKNLHINLSKETTVIEQFNMILNELDKTGENNLIILDIQKNHDQKFSEINRILSLRNWKKIVLTRSNLKNLNPYLLPNLNYESAYNLFKLHCSKEFDETLFREFLEFIEYNTLTIELVSKTIENSYDLTLEFIYDALKTQNLNSNLLKIDIDLNDEENRVVAIFDFILQSFSIENLENKEKYFLQYLALLPPSDIVIEDLILICGREFYDGNKLSYLNSINALEKKGLLQYENNKKSIRIHKILQETILYRLRNENSPCVGFIYYITWLSHRLAEGYNNPKESFKYLKYAESILRNIKEEFRTNIYQPLLLLENEYLHLSSFFFIRENIDKLWEDLINRTEKYLGKDARCLAAMYNNLASTLNVENSLDTIIKYQRKANQLYLQNIGNFKDGDLLMYITSLHNLAQAYLLKDDPINVVKCLHKVATLRKQNYFYNDAQIGVGYTILSQIHRKTKNFDESDAFIKEAIKYHNSIPAEKRNHFLLSNYYNKLAENSIFKNNLEEALSHQLQCVEIMEEQEIRNTYSVKMYEFLINLYKISTVPEVSKVYINKLELLKQQNQN